MEKLLVDFNENTHGEFDYLRLSSVDVSVKKQACDFTFIYPAEKEELVLNRREYIEQELKRVINSSAEVKIKLKKSHFDFDFFKADFFAFLSAYPTLSSTLTGGDLLCEKKESGEYVIKLVMTQTVADYCNNKNIRTDIENFLYVNFCEKISVEFFVNNDDISYGQPQEIAAESAFVLDRPDEGRFIRPQNVEEFIGKIIYEPAGYISDATVKDYAVLCGTLSKIYEQMRKPKPEQEQAVRKFFKFSIEDFTGSIQCVYFPNKKTVNDFSLLIPGKQIVARGKIEEDTYKKDGSLVFYIRDISLCTLPKTFTQNKIRRKVPKNYSTVFPEKYVEQKQYSLFESASEQKKVPPYMLGKTFCVFDIETTGFNTDTDGVTEIGAVKLVDGVITETFSTFVDPLMPIPERITKLTHITDADVKGKPLIKDVLLDFYKFTENTILVGQNVQFDHGFIQAKGAPLGIYFENRLLDTLSLTKEFYPDLPNYTLGTIAKFFNVVNKGAHRAVNDAWTTMEIFIKLAEKLN